MNDEKKREIRELPLDVRICILRRIIMENNAKECALIEESRRCRDELLKLGVEAFPPFPKDQKEEANKRTIYYTNMGQTICRTTQSQALT